MKSVYNKIVRVDSNIPTQNLNDLNDVNTATATNGQILKFSAGNWVNANETAGVTSFNTRTGDVTLQASDLNGLVYNYYNFIRTPSTVPFTAVANTHYYLSFGGTITIPPLNPGEHIMISAHGNTITVNFSGTSYVTNSYTGGGGVANPTIILLYATIELQCNVNNGQTYYSIVRVSQNANPSTCTLNGVKIAAINSLNNIPDVNISGAVDGQVLTSLGGQWVNATPSGGGAVTSVFGRTGAVAAVNGDYSLNLLSDVTLSTPVSGQILGFNGLQWVNKNEAVTSVFGRTGAVAATAGDYNLTMLGDVSTPTPENMQFLRYDGTNWVNSDLYGVFIYRLSLFSQTLTGAPYYVYYSNNSTINLPNGTAMPFGGRIRIISTNGTTTVGFPTNTGFSFQGSVQGAGISLSTTTLSTIELECINITGSTAYYRPVVLAGTWTASYQTKKIGTDLLRLDDADNVLITTPSSGQILSYNGTNWINTAVPTTTKFIEFNSRGNLVNGTYMCQNGTVSGDIRLAHVLIPRATTILNISGQVNIASTAGAGWRYFLYKNGTSTGIFVEMLGSTTSATAVANISYSQFDTLEIYITQVGGATVPAGWCTVEY